MSKPRRNKALLSLDDPLVAAKQRKAVPHEFVLDAIASLSPRTHPMFGCLAVYVEDKIVLILRDKREETADNGVVARHHRGVPRESATRVSEYAIHSGIREGGHRLAGASGRCAGFRGGGAARLRAHCRHGSSNRQGAGGAAGLEIERQEGAEIPCASKGTQESRERSREVVRFLNCPVRNTDLLEMPGTKRGGKKELLNTF